MAGWVYSSRPLHDLQFNSHAQWRHLVACGSNSYFAFFPQVWLSSPADTLKLTTSTKPPAFKGWGNFSICRDNSGNCHLVFAVLICFVFLKYIFMYAVGTFRRWAALTARTARPRKQSGRTTSPWSQREPMGLKRECVSCGTKLWCVCSVLCARCLHGVVMSS